MLAKKPADRAPCVPMLLKQFGVAVDTAVAPEARAKLDAWLAEQGQDHPPMVADSGGTVPILFNPLDSTPVTAAARRSRGRRRNSPLIVGAVAASLILVGGLAFFFTSGMRGPQRTLGAGAGPVAAVERIRFPRYRVGRQRSRSRQRASVLSEPRLRGAGVPV